MALGDFYVATTGPISGPILLDGFALVVRDPQTAILLVRQREESWKSVLHDSDPVVMHSFSIDLMGPDNPRPKAMRSKKGKQNEKL